MWLHLHHTHVLLQIFNKSIEHIIANNKSLFIHTDELTRENDLLQQAYDKRTWLMLRGNRDPNDYIQRSSCHSK